MVRLTFLPLLLAAVSGAGCNAIAGIHDGTLADTSGGDASKPRDGGADVTSTHKDGAADTGHPSDTGHPVDTGSDASTPLHDSGKDAATQTFACEPRGKPQLIQSLANTDGGMNSFSPSGVFLAPTTVSGQFYVVAQPESTSDTFGVYQVYAPAQTPVSNPMSGLSTLGEVNLLDLFFVRDGAEVTIRVLASYYAGASGSGSISALQVVPLAPSFIESMAAAPFEIARGTSTFNVAWLSPGVPIPDAGEQGAWLSVETGRARAVDYLAMGEGPGTADNPIPNVAIDAGGIPLASLSKPPFFTVGGRYHALLTDQMANQGITDFSATRDLAEAGALGTIPAPDAGAWVVLGAKTADVGAGQAVVFLAAPSANDTYTTYTAIVPAAQLDGLTIADGGLQAGATFPQENQPYSAVSRGWFSDDLVNFGTTNLSVGLRLNWFGHDGGLHARSGVMFNDGNTIVASAVQFDTYNAASGSTFDVAWIESVSTSDGSTYQELYAAQVLCAPGVDGGS